MEFFRKLDVSYRYKMFNLLYLFNKIYLETLDTIVQNIVQNKLAGSSM